MLDRKQEPVKWNITHRFALWTTRAAMRGWSHGNVSRALEAVDFDQLLNTNCGRINREQFTKWHKSEIRKLKRLEFTTKGGRSKSLNVGWAAKMIAIYLKTTCYLAGFGREGLAAVMHPPIDNYLREILLNQMSNFADAGAARIRDGLGAATSISDIDEMSYDRIIEACRLLANRRGCTLFEVEQYWTLSPSED